MADPRRLHTVAAIECQATLPMLARLLDEAVDDGALASYAETSQRPDLAGYGDTRKALESAQYAKGVDSEFASTVAVGAIIRVLAAQQQEILELKAALPKAKAGKRS